MNTEQINETADEQAYRDISSRLTAIDCDISTAQENLANYVFQNQLRTPEVREKTNQLQAELEAVQAQRQRLLPMFADLKSRILGW